MFYIAWLILFISLKTSHAAKFNRTIDDTLGDSVTGEKPLYLPSTAGVWEDADCKGCLLQPDRILAFNGTWTAATYTPTIESMSIELNFKGTAIYVFFILANIVEPDNPTETACNFTLDGRPMGSFQHKPIPTNEFLFDSPVFSQDNLSNVDHRLSISTSNLNRKVWINFDYAIYTTDDSPVQSSPSSLSSTSSLSSPSSPPASLTPTDTPLIPPSHLDGTGPKIGAIVGGIVGGIIAFLLLGLTLFLWSRRARRAQMNDDEYPIGLSPIRQPYNDFNAQFVTPFADPSMHQKSLTNFEIHHPSNIFPPTFEFPDRAMNTNPYLDGGPYYQSHPVSLANIPMSRREKSPAPINTSTNVEVNISSSSSGPPQDDAIEMIRRERQAEIGRRMDALRQNMRYLKGVGPFYRRPAGGQRSGEISNLQGDIQLLREQIGHLQAQQQSPWAQGLSDEPPPGYSEAPPTH